MNGTGRRLALALAGAALAACSATDTRLDSNSGGDAARDQAMALFIDRTVTDRLDAPGGDHTDWKYVDILDKGKMRVEVSVDQPEQLGKAYVELTDAFGNRLDRQLVSQGQTNYVFTREVETVPDKYYVRAFTEQGGSVYTVGVRLAYAPAPPPPPQPKIKEPEPEPEPVKKQPRRRTPRTRPRPTPRPDPTPPPVEKPPPTEEVIIVTGRVVRIIPAKDDQSVELTILLNGADPVGRTTHSAVAYRGGSRLGPVTGLRVEGRQVIGDLALPPGKVTGSITVKFTPR